MLRYFEAGHGRAPQLEDGVVSKKIFGDLVSNRIGYEYEHAMSAYRKNFEISHAAIAAEIERINRDLEEYRSSGEFIGEKADDGQTIWDQEQTYEVEKKLPQNRLKNYGDRASSPPTIGGSEQFESTQNPKRDPMKNSPKLLRSMASAYRLNSTKCGI